MKLFILECNLKVCAGIVNNNLTIRVDKKYDEEVKVSTQHLIIHHSLNIVIIIKKMNMNLKKYFFLIIIIYFNPLKMCYLEHYFQLYILNIDIR